MTRARVPRRRTALNAGLVLVVAALAAAVALAPAPDTAAPVLLPQLATRDVHAIRIIRAGAPDLELRRDGTQWFLHAPLRAPANPRRIDVLLATAALPVAATLDGSGAARRRFGLEPPAATLALGDAQVAFGGTEPLHGRRYVLHAGRVHLVPDAVFAQLTQGEGFFIDPRLVRDGLRLKRIATPLRELRLEQGEWRSLTAPEPGDPAAADVARAWQETEALSVVAGVGPERGTDVTLDLDGGAVIRFEFVVRDGQMLLLRRDLGIGYVLGPGQARQLLLVREPADGAATAP